MAATDQEYRNQYSLDVVFAVSSILMLASTVWMLWDDYRREFKTEQRQFRDVEMALAQREALLAIPSDAEFKAAKKAVETAKVKRDEEKGKADALNREIHELLPDKERSELKLADLKAFLDSKKSLYDIQVEKSNSTQTAHALQLKSEIEGLEKEIIVVRGQVEEQVQIIKGKQRQRDEIEQPLTKAIGSLKKLLDTFDRQVALAIKKRWTGFDDFRSLPVIDGFASPTKIEQITLNDLTIDYNFKGVTRFDRCTTCHKGIARPNFTKASLQDLWYAPSDQLKDRLDDARDILEERKALLAGLPEGNNLLDPNLLTVTPLSDRKLTQARINEFCVHPRLDLFVAPNSKHPAEKFGCTSCHSGQPSGTSFTFAAHTPNNDATKKQWQHEHDWEAQHMWDFPMLPQRFVESSCIKCHHQVTDLYSDGNKTEAPKLLKGYNVIREYGCFGCHEISGYKGGRPVGPDMRLEPIPPLEHQSVADQAKLYADPDNPPGTMRKIAPSLYRVSEKTYKEWALKWLMAPREFRPDTKMPHYYGLSNNGEEALRGTGQEHFPAAEIHGIVHYLFNSSQNYFALADTIKNIESKGDKVTDDEKKRLKEAKDVVAAHGAPQPLDKKLGDIRGDAKLGRDLFSKRGCLACHSHNATNTEDANWPAIPSEADFGPNLTQIKEKLVRDPKDLKQATIWLTNWVKNPAIHNPRTRMPVTHLSDQEAADIAAWLLAQDMPIDKKTGTVPEDLRGEKWDTMNVSAPSDVDLQDLARVYLVRTLAKYEMDQLFENKLSKYRVSDLGADERELVELLGRAKDKADSRNAMLHFVGKKAIGRLGCFACHDIPGFDNAKPIGTALAEWGKKDAARLAFEDVANYVKDYKDHDGHKYQVVDKLVDEDGYPLSVKNGPLYEKFFYDALMHQTREGFLHQKLLEPRSYDYNKLLAWDDRARMPQFKFQKARKKAKEDVGDFKLRKQWADAMDKPLDTDAGPQKAESTDSFLARKAKEDADNREAVMTFVLGLVGDPIPFQYLNQPGPERLAAVKGRQVLDKFNCAGCHVLRPGVYEFKLSAGAKKTLGDMYAKNKKENIYKDDYDSEFFKEHRAWFQPMQTGDVIEAHGVRPLLNGTNKKVNLLLTEALHVGSKGDEKSAVSFRAKDLMSLSPRDMIWPPRSAFATTDSFHAWEKEHGTQGGTFASLLSNYLKEEKIPDKTKYAEPGPFVPPVLVWQGERTQPDWLFQFLLDPPRIREITVLRMPKFNMSEEEARTLVNYFASIERHFNPDINLVSPYPKVPQRTDLDTAYWQVKTAKYIENLKKAGQYQKEVDAYKPVWEKMLKDWKSDAKNAVDRSDAANNEVKKSDDAFKAAKDDKQKTQLQKEKESADLVAAFWKTEKDRLDKLVASKTLKSLEEDWSRNEAYAVAGYRLVVNQCNKCHAVGKLDAQQLENRGPSLNFSAARLRPEWSHRWIANPQRFIPYTSAMPAYFPKSSTEPLALWVPGTHQEQIDTVRDAILNLDRISELPMTRYFMQSGGK